MRILTILASTALLAACGGQPAAVNEGDAPEFFTRLSALCGQAFEGRVTSDDPRDADWAAETLVMHVRECSDDVIRIPLHVGEDRSRTWVISVLEDGQMRLKHDHRHEDGSEDAMTQYGGDTVEQPSETRAAFPADQFSKDLFEEGGIPDSMGNTWSLTLTENVFKYALDRTNRHFEATFDLSNPVEAPPAPWGFE